MKELEINEEQASVVKMIFGLYVSGIGSFTISKMLNEKGINIELKRINDEISNYENIKNSNKNIQEQMKKIEKILETPHSIKEFDENIFNNLVEKIIVGEKDDKGNINSKVVRFILKIGTEYVYDINDDKSVSFRPNSLEEFS